MNFEKKSLVVLLVILVFLLSSCEVYQTLYGNFTGTPNTVQPNVVKITKVVRVEESQAKDSAILAKAVYSASNATEHDAFKTGKNPLGPFDKGESLGFTLGDWLAATGSGSYTVNESKAEIKLSFKNLVPNGVYTLWCSRLTFPPHPKIVDRPCGASDGSENSFNADAAGDADFDLSIKTLEDSTKETNSVIALAYHSDGKTHGASPGDFGLNSHVQLFFLIPPRENQNKTMRAYDVPVKLISHIDAGLPEQDVFVEYSEQPTNTVSEKPNEKMNEGEATKPVEIQQVTTEKNPNEKPVVVTVQETDKVTLVPKAEDPDNGTNLAFTYTSPLNEKGEWQTSYGDAGQYTITLTVSDGELTTSKDVLLIVDKKEEAPTIDSAKPIESGLTIDEEQTINFSIVANDLNKDPLAYSWKLDGIDVGKNNQYTYQTDYDSEGTHTVKVEVSDGTLSASKIWSINVRNVNRPPVLDKIDDIKAKETEKIVITALATDPDKDPITYSINNKGFKQEDNVFTWQTDYDSAGIYQVTVSASDGKDVVNRTFTVTVENVDRPPVILDIVQKK